MPAIIVSRKELLVSGAAIAARRARIDEPHVQALNNLVREFRRARPHLTVPWFDPADGGVNARVLLLLEIPTRRRSGPALSA